MEKESQKQIRKEPRTIEDFAINCLGKKHPENPGESTKLFNHIAKHYSVSTNSIDLFKPRKIYDTKRPNFQEDESD